MDDSAEQGKSHVICSHQMGTPARRERGFERETTGERGGAIGMDERES